MIVAYVVSQYPALSETFIAREMEQLAAIGHDVRVVRLRWQGRGFGQSLGRPVDGVTVLPVPLRPDRLVRGLAWAWTRQPRAMATILRDAVASGGPPSIRLRLLGVACAVAGAARVLAGVDIGHVRANFFSSESIGASWLSRLVDAPYSVSVSTLTTRFPESLVRRVVCEASFCAATTAESYDFVARWRGGDERIVPIRRGVVVPDGPLVARQRIPRSEGQPFRVLGVGRLVPQKGFGTLVDACARLRDAGVPVQCDVIGEGPLREALTRTIERHGLTDRVRLRGALPQNEVQEHYRQSDLLVVPSTDGDETGRDGLPNVVIEAMAVGLPVVGARYAGIPDLVVDGESGRLVPPDAPDALADAVHDALSSPRRRIAWAQAGRERVRRDYNLEREVGTMDAWMRRVRR